MKIKNGEKYGNVWYAALTVPSEVRHVIGHGRYYQSTKTGSDGEASVRIPALVAVWRSEIAKARGTIPDTRDTFWHDIRKEYAEAEESDQERDGDGGGVSANEVRDAIYAAALKIDVRGSTAEG